MTKLLPYLIVFFVGTITGFVDSTVGGGGMISIPALIFLGLPPQIAVATDRLGTVGQVISAFPKYFQSKKIVWKYTIPFVVLSAIGALIGAHLLLSIETSIVQKTIAIISLLLLPSVLANLNSKVSHTSPIQKDLIGYFVRLILQLIQGFLGTGTGSLSTFTNLYFFKMTIVESIATGLIPSFILSVFSLSIFLYNGLVNLEFGIAIFAGMSIGGLIGSKFAVEYETNWIKYMFAVLVIISSVRLLL